MMKLRLAAQAMTWFAVMLGVLFSEQYALYRMTDPFDSEHFNARGSRSSLAADRAM